MMACKHDVTSFGLAKSTAVKFYVFFVEVI
jgi:hypothetical protein